MEHGELVETSTYGASVVSTLLESHSQQKSASASLGFKNLDSEKVRLSVRTAGLNEPQNMKHQAKNGVL